MIRQTPFLTAFVLLVGCAHYSARPLGVGPSVLSAPVATVLETQAQAIDRPWLKPVALDVSAPLDDDALAALAVVNNPDLKAQRARAGVADAQAFAAGLLPDPTISLGVDKVLSGPDTMLNLTGALGVDLNALRTQAVTRERARAEARQVRLDLAWAEWQTAGQARIQAARVLGLTSIAELARESDAAAQSLLDRTLRAAARGDVAGDQVLSARSAAVDVSSKLRTAERDLATARSELDKLLGLPPDTDLRLAPSPGVAPPPSADILFAIALQNRTDLRALRAGYAAEEAAVHKAVLDQFPTLGLTINANRDSANNLLVGPAVDFTLPLWNRNRGGIAIVRATRAALKAEYDARLFQTRADIAAAVSGLALARRQEADARRSLPELRRLAEASDQAADRGDISVAAAQAAQQTLRDRLSLIAQGEQDVQELMISLELLTGAPREAWGR